MKTQFISLGTLADRYQNFQSREIIPGQWNDGEICLLYSSANATGDKKRAHNYYPNSGEENNPGRSKSKTIDAVCNIIQKAAANDANRQFLYIDTENSSPQLISVLPHDTHLAIYRPSFDADNENLDYADIVISAVETAVRETDIRTFVIDSVNRIAAASFGRNASPVHVMKKLVSLQMRFGISLLVIAHTDSRSTISALAALANTEIDVSAMTRSQCSLQPLYNLPKEHTPVTPLAQDSPAPSTVATAGEFPQSMQIADNLYLNFNNPDLPRAERRRALREFRKLQNTHHL